VTTQQIIWTVVIVVAALVVIGLIVASMRKKSQQDNRARAAEIREAAEAKAATIPDTQARARETEAQAEQARLQAERAEERAQAARTAAAQQEALHEDQVRAADRLDPDVDHRADDYTPETVTPAAAPGTHAAERTEPETAQHPTAAPTGTHAGERTESETTDVHPETSRTASTTDERSTSDPETIFDSRDTDNTTDNTTDSTTDTTPGTGTHRDSATEPDWTDPDQRGGTGTPGGSHRA
jgi:hypothetical protein